MDGEDNERGKRGKRGKRAETLDVRLDPKISIATNHKEAECTPRSTPFPSGSVPHGCGSACSNFSPLILHQSILALVVRCCAVLGMETLAVQPAVSFASKAVMTICVH